VAPGAQLISSRFQFPENLTYLAPKVEAEKVRQFIAERGATGFSVAINAWLPSSDRGLSDLMASDLGLLWWALEDLNL
jgi:hypothetical protein